jgi:protein-S-isoprenylcysteine O-methyltransferase Ste14
MSHPQPPVQSRAGENWARIARRIRVPLSFVAAAAFVWLAHPTRFSLMVGSLVIIPGLLLRGVASGHVQKDKQLTTSGPYGYTRNPLYLGSFIMAIGFAFAARSLWIVLLMLLIVVLIYVPMIAGEERYLRQTFAEYADYASHVPRILPRLTPYGKQKGSYSRERFWKHREYQATLGSALLVGILVAKLVISS